tara:strand:+ start:2334 stop:2513 length:180 start_codon:yes stop_codon:yes gene_type:complete
MKEIDDTPLPENESEEPEWVALVEIINKVHISLLRLEKRVANLETQRTPQDENDDPEWF